MVHSGGDDDLWNSRSRVGSEWVGQRPHRRLPCRPTALCPPPHTQTKRARAAGSVIGGYVAERIDFIWVSASPSTVRVVSCELALQEIPHSGSSKDGLFYSDHYGVLAELELPDTRAGCVQGLGLAACVRAYVCARVCACVPSVDFSRYTCIRATWVQCSAAG